MKTSIAVLASLMASVAAAQTFRVSGTVVDSESGAPLGRTRVVLSDGAAREQSVITTANGRFSFDAPQGKHTLLAAHRDFGQSYGQRLSGGADSAIVTGPDLDTTGLVLRWRAPVAIHGTIVDESGEPVFDAKIEVFVEAVTGGRKRIVSLGSAESDEAGQYSWSSLAAGTYYLAATGVPWYLFKPDENSFTETGLPGPYALTYFPSGNDARAAAPLTLRPGAEARADFVLRPAIGADLRFQCACMGSLKLFAAGIGGAEAFVASTEVIETAVIPRIASGRYVVRYSGPDGSMRKEIEVGGGEMTVEITPKPLPTLTGRVTLENRHVAARHPVYVNALDDSTGEGVTVPVDAQGSFCLPSIPVSRVRLFLSGEDEFFVSAMSVEGASVKDGVIEIVDGAVVKVDLTASGETGRLNGFVIAGDKPVAMAMVVLAQAGTGRNFGFQTDSDGSFEFPAAPAGEYVVFAVEDQEFAYANPETVRPYLAAGKRVRIKARGIQTERIGLVSREHE